MFAPECRVSGCALSLLKHLGNSLELVYSSLYGGSPDKHCLVSNISGELDCTKSNSDSAHLFKVNLGTFTF